MKRAFSLGLSVLGFALLAASAQAATANFQGNCQWNASNTAINCVFDAQRPSSSPSSCASGSPEYFWDYGDGASSGYTYSSFTSHTYAPPAPGQYGYYPSLAVFCPEGSASIQRYICIYGFGYPGCIFQDGNWY